jgi:Yip1 domain
MIKALFLIFEPHVAWERIAQSRRGLGFVLAFYLLPMMLIVTLVGGLGLVEWGKWQSATGRIQIFTLNEALIYETAQLLLMFLVVAVCAHLIKALGETFHGRHSYTQTFTVVAYGLSPVFLFRLLDVIPHMNPWLTWGLGVLASIVILYYGIPLVMQPDPPHAFGLYLMSCLLLIMVTGLERFLTAWYLSGHFAPLEDFVSNLAARLPF